MGKKVKKATSDTNITKTHFGVYGSIVKDGKILLIKKSRGPYTGLYDLPGGSQEQGESHLETLKREIMEETGCVFFKPSVGKRAFDV